MSNYLFKITAAAICLIWVSLVYSQQSSGDVVAKLAEDAATNICGEVPDSGWKAGAELSSSASIDPNLSRFINKIIKANVAGTAKLGGDGYFGPLQVDLAKVRADTQNCKVEIAMKLIEYVEKTQAAANVPKEERIQASELHLVPVEPTYPSMKAETYARRWLTLIEEREFHAAYELYDPAINSIVTEKEWEEQASKSFQGCLPALSRNIDMNDTGEGPSVSQPGQNEWYIAFKTIFKGGKTYVNGDESNEKVGLVLINGKWGIRDYSNACMQAGSEKERASSEVKPQPPLPEPVTVEH
ncbi:hypothetical protein [Dyella psychrodurans]|uniref:DUF4019 domain-containing protein n=1 Tax=Dyella psychrodurans TaxID=1927960 RepID=A0A370WXS5_9GAMM|nr:hypothetical protein [Dyella psychrodurans]RDS80953.1 hypothetical protein DWU99_18025 [Dyella psychrodurans]